MTVSEVREREVQGLKQSLTSGALPASWEKGSCMIILHKESFIISIDFKFIFN